MRNSRKERGSEKAQVVIVVGGGMDAVDGVGREEAMEDGVEDDLRMLLLSLLLLLLFVVPDGMVGAGVVYIRDWIVDLEVLLRLRLFAVVTTASCRCSFGDDFFAVDDDENNVCGPWGACRTTVRADIGVDVDVVGLVRSMDDDTAEACCWTVVVLVLFIGLVTMA